MTDSGGRVSPRSAFQQACDEADEVRTGMSSIAQLVAANPPGTVPNVSAPTFTDPAPTLEQAFDAVRAEVERTGDALVFHPETAPCELCNAPARRGTHALGPVCSGCITSGLATRVALKIRQAVDDTREDIALAITRHAASCIVLGLDREANALRAATREAHRT